MFDFIFLHSPVIIILIRFIVFYQINITSLMRATTNHSLNKSYSTAE